MDFILERVKDKNPDGSLQIMYTIHGKCTPDCIQSMLTLAVGEKLFPELELTHLDGHKASKPVR